VRFGGRHFEQDVKDQMKLAPKGIERRMPYRGSVAAIVRQLAGGLPHPAREGRRFEDSEQHFRLVTV
jgi:hypothetical protein